MSIRRSDSPTPKPRPQISLKSLVKQAASNNAQQTQQTQQTPQRSGGGFETSNTRLAQALKLTAQSPNTGILGQRPAAPGVSTAAQASRNTSSSTVTQEGNLRTATQSYDRFSRNGQVTSHSFGQQVSQQYREASANSSKFFSRNEYSHTNVTNSPFQLGRLTGGTETTRTSTGFSERASSHNYADGKFEYNTSGSMQRDRTYNKQGSASYDSRAAQRGTPEDAARTQRNADQQAKMDGYQAKAEELADKYGLRTTLASGSTSNVSRNALVETENSFVGTEVQTSSQGEVTLGVDGLKAQGSASASAGVYAQTKGKASGKYGEVEGDASAYAAAYAAAQGQMQIGINGLQAEGSARVGVEATARVSGSYTSPSVNIGGVPMNASVNADASVTAKAVAEASGRVQITANPPTAVVEGEVGASAVVKAEANATVKAGPFGLTANAYASAGAEARAFVKAGYSDGKLSLGFGLGAALGIGAGFNVGITIDVKQIGQAAVGLVKDAGKAVANVAKDVGKAVGNAAKDVGKAVSNAAKDVGKAVTNVAKDVGNAVSKAASAVKKVFSGW